jgi:HEPN domain
LREAIAQDAYASPMAIIHSSYYAMFHAARAVLFQVTGRAPKRHDWVIQQSGLLVRGFDNALRDGGKAFNEIKDERTAARLRRDDRAVIWGSARRIAGGDWFPCGLRWALRVSVVACSSVLIVLEQPEDRDPDVRIRQRTMLQKW